MVKNLDLVSPSCDDGRAWTGHRVWLERGYQRARGQNEGIEGPSGAAASRSVPQTQLGLPFFAKRGCRRVLGSGLKAFPGKTLYLHPISAADKSTFKCHLPTHSLSCSPSPACQASPQGANRQLNWDVLPPLCVMTLVPSQEMPYTQDICLCLC